MCDSTGSLDRVNSKLFRMVCPSPAGALPLATVILSTENFSSMSEAYSILKDLLPSTAFFNRGPIGPRIFITDDCEPEYRALLSVWPLATHYLCVWHVLEAVHRWILAGRNNITNADDRKHLFKLFQNMMYASSLEKYNECLEAFEQYKTVQNYENFYHHIESEYLNRPEK